MPSFLSVIDSKNYVGNVILRMLGQYFSIRQPDSGLTVSGAYDGLVNSVVINPTQIDIRRVSSTISSFSFKLVDQNRVVTALIEGDAASFLDTEVEIWVGRSGVAMDFADYFKLPTTRIKKIDYADGSYSFATQEQTERLNRALFQTATTLDVDILAATTSIDVGAEITDFPDSGYVKIENELMSFTGRDLTERRLLNVIRGEFSTVPAEHKSGSSVFHVVPVSGNPIDIALKILQSGSGGQYDLLPDGCGLSDTLVDIAGIEVLRDSEFSEFQVQAFLYQLNGLKWLEEEILTPLSLRFSTSKDSKLTLKQTDRIAVREANSEITNTTIKGSPKWSVDASRIVNRITVEWDYDESVSKYTQSSTYSDESSIAKYGEKDKLSYRFKLPRVDLGGQYIVDDFAKRLLRRLSTPTPEISLTTHIDKSIYGPVDRVKVTTNQLPDYDGTLDFASELEIVSRAINYMNGDVSFRLQFVSNTLHNLGFIAPSDPILYAMTAYNQITLPAGRGAYYSKGWVLMPWHRAGRFPFYDGPYTVIDIIGDVLTFDYEIDLLLPGNGIWELRFADYNLVSEDQKRFAFLVDQGENFADGKLPYKVTF